MTLRRALVAIGRDAERFFPPDRLEHLRKLVALHVSTPPWSPTDYDAALARVQPEIVITGWDSPFLSASLLARNPQLRYLCHIAGSVRSVVDRKAIEAGLFVTNWGQSISRTVAEAALLAILSSLRCTTHVDLLTHRDSGWLDRRQKDIVRSLFGRRVGLHGFGNTARFLVILLRPFDCVVSAYDPHVAPTVFAEHAVAAAADLRELYSSNDVVSIHCTGNADTHHVVDASLLASMPDGAILVNTARGSVIDVEALAAELQKGRITASLDVFEEEPLPVTSVLRGLPNCQITCHTAGPTVDRVVDAGDLAIESIRRYLEGAAPLDNVVDSHGYDRHS